MNNGWIDRREIVLTEFAAKSVKDLTKKYTRFEKQWNGLKWILQRTPEKGQPLRLENIGGVYYAMRKYGDPTCDLVEVIALYTYDEKEIKIYGVKVLEPSDF